MEIKIKVKRPGKGKVDMLISCTKKELAVLSKLTKQQMKNELKITKK